MKKIIVITGSPRKNGNSSKMADGFIKTIVEGGAQATRFDAAFMKIGGCHACDKCYKNEKACVYDDDFNVLAKELETADGIVFVAPVYWYTFPAQIKAVIDRLYAMYVGERFFEGKKCALIS